MTTEELIDSSLVCFANKTTKLVNKLTLGLECKDIDYQCLYAYLMDIYALSKWNHYADDTADSNLPNCLTNDEINTVIELLKKRLVSCGLSTNTGIPIVNNISVLDFLTDNFEYILV